MNPIQNRPGYQCLAFSAALILAPLVAHAATFTATQSGDWNQNSTWGGNAAPTSVAAGDTVEIGSAFTVTLPPQVNVANAGVINNSGSIALQWNLNNELGGVIHNQGTGTVAGSGTIMTDGQIDNDGALTVNNLTTTGTINNHGTLTVNFFYNTGTINNFASLLNSFSPGVLANNPGGVIHNQSGALLDTSTQLFNGATSSIINDGTVDNHGGGTIDNRGTIANSGTFSNEGGVINNSPSGIITNNSGGTIINNSALVHNLGDCDIGGLITNNGDINNGNGTIINECHANYAGLAPSGNPVQAVPCDLSYPSLSLISDGPDPFTPNGDGINDVTVVQFTVDEPGTYSLLWRTIANPVVWLRTIRGTMTAGVNGVAWDGKDDNGDLVPCGTYYYFIVATDLACNSTTYTTSGGDGHVDVQRTGATINTATATDRRTSDTVLSGGSTTKTAMTFTFTGTETSLDALPFVASPSPVSFDRLKQGAHTFRVRACALDPTPAVFNWTIRKGK